ncbi:carboxylating nicotinate-nucleotide diphosphorylase [Pontibacillus marinus]|uniref:Probable nicotinate-nucleotide pyrophosphorylase [carboxylating] n=1 Tax=Pontibacillus marinus BH030004 = DSM 16465 TaxID=1385511 RepID=A0A0A5FYY5_9BACI|nr:carboxylating nicotinate-nucleotide diphosphorylase [Pontibacillus marinus]KGX84015.1 nicotinate-nucleotide pyrophosphorylase [Pontibacillus marinus BH030004 = DSM 16465]
MNLLKMQQQLEAFFIEDIGDHDVTSDVLFQEGTEGEIVFISKQDGIFCGSEIIRRGFRLLDESTIVNVNVQDGESIHAGQTLATVFGKMAILLKGERVILNLIQRMSGIATKTNEAVRSLSSDHTRICDTRKTTPGLRMFEKYAVRSGGGFNHRNGLYDAVMIKDNHIAFAGSITKAVQMVRGQLGHMVKVEVETESKEQVLEAVEAKADCIMFDNQTPESISELVTLVPNNIVTEASGGIQIENLHDYGKTGVDYISLGCLTHSAPSLDISVRVHTQ